MLFFFLFRLNKCLFYDESNKNIANLIFFYIAQKQEYI